MENRPVYVVDKCVATSLRAETLQPATNWQSPTPAEINLALSMASWSGEEFAKKTGVQSSTIRCYRRGEKKIPYALWVMLCDAAGLGRIW